MSAAPRRAPGDVLVHLRRARDHADLHYAEPLDLAALAAVVAARRERDVARLAREESLRRRLTGSR